MKIAVTGASGFVGSYLTKELIKLGHEINSIKHNDVDLTNFEFLLEHFKKNKPDAIYHLAAQSSPHISWKQPYKTLKDNILSSLNMLQIAEILDIKLIMAGSAEVYDTDCLKLHEKLTEESILQPRNPYGLSKLTLDYLIKMIAEERGIKVILLRIFNNIGPGQSDTFVVSTFAKQLAQIKLGLQEPIIKVGNLNAKRDFVNVNDAVKAYIKCLDFNKFEIFNVCSGQSYVIKDILNILINISGLDVKVIEDPARMRPSDIPEFVGDYSKLASLGWTPSTPIEETLKDVFDDWVEKLGGE